MLHINNNVIHNILVHPFIKFVGTAQFSDLQCLRPEGGGGGGGKHHLFSFHICDRAAEDKQVEKNRIKIRLCIPEILHVEV